MERQIDTMDKTKLWEIFLRDSKDFKETLDASVPKLADNPKESAEIIAGIYRALHSIKSEADFLKLNNIADSANSVEEALERFKQEGDPSEVVERYRKLRSCIETIQNLEGKKFRPLTPLESERVHEAFDRDEKIYTVKFIAREDEEEPSARLCLALDRLERIRNVIASDPSADVLEEQNPESITILFSHGGKIPEKNEMPRVDRLEMQGPFLFNPNQAVERKEQAAAPEAENDSVVSPRVPIEGMNKGYLAENFQKTLFLSASLIHKTDDLDESNKKRLLSNVLYLDNHITRTEKVNLKGVLEEISESGRRMAEEEGKRVRIDITMGSLLVFPPIAELITEIVIQLIRNSVFHGIEKPQERSKKGKSPDGSIKIDVVRKSGIDTITVSDDGTGIAEDMIREKTKNYDSDILDIIASSGFTTQQKAARGSGRGVGLDTVRYTTEKLMGGKISLKNEENAGTVFRITVPSDLRPIRFIVCRTGNSYLAIPAFGIKKSEQTKRADAGEYARKSRCRVLGDENRESEREVRLIHYSDGASVFVLFTDSLVSEEVAVLSPLRQKKVYSQTARHSALVIPPLKGKKLR